MTKEELVRAEDMGDYFRVTPDERDLNYDKYTAVINTVTEMNEAYSSHNTKLLNVDETINKIMTTDYVREQLNGNV